MISNLITDSIGQFVSFLQGYLFALLAIGLLSMALLEALKKTLSIRQKYNLFHIKRWIKYDDLGRERFNKLIFANDKESKNSSEKSYHAYEELLHLTTGSNYAELLKEERKSSFFEVFNFYSADERFTVFSLDISKMMGHVQIAVDSTIDTPHKYPSLYSFITSGADFSDVKEWYQNAQKSELDVEDTSIAKKRADQFMTLQRLAKRKLDTFQLKKDYRWTNLNQLYALLIGSLLMFLVLFLVNLSNVLNVEIILGFLLISSIGGIFAPIIKDLIGIIGNIKDRG